MPPWDFSNIHRSKGEGFTGKTNWELQYLAALDSVEDPAEETARKLKRGKMD